MNRAWSPLAGAVVLGGIAASSLPAQSTGDVQERALGYSVAVASYRSLNSALAARHRIDEAGILLFVSPTTLPSATYYRLLAGAVASRDAAAALMERLVATGLKSEAKDWDIRSVPLAHHFASHGSEAEARARVRALSFQGVPAYIVPGASTYHVYGGAYESRGQARAMEELMEARGVNAELRQRVGLDSAPEAVAAAEPRETEPPEVRPPAGEEGPPVEPPEADPEVGPVDAPDPSEETEPLRPALPPDLPTVPSRSGAGPSIGLKAGLAYPGCLTPDGGGCSGSDLSYGLGGFVDWRISSSLLGGVALDLYGVGHRDVVADVQDFIDLSLTLKLDLSGTASRSGVRPGIAIGYGTSELGADHFLTGRALLELVVPSAGRIGWLMELSALGALGRADNADLSVGPGLLARAGLVF